MEFHNENQNSLGIITLLYNSCESAILSAHMRIRTGEHTKSKQVCSHLFTFLTHAQEGL